MLCRAQGSPAQGGDGEGLAGCRSRGRSQDRAAAGHIRDTGTSVGAEIDPEINGDKDEEVGEEEELEEEAGDGDKDTDGFHSLRHVRPYAREAARALDRLQATTVAPAGDLRRPRRACGGGSAAATLLG
jgi:hypothetical protein